MNSPETSRQLQSISGWWREGTTIPLSWKMGSDQERCHSLMAIALSMRHMSSFRMLARCQSSNRCPLWCQLVLKPMIITANGNSNSRTGSPASRCQIQHTRQSTQHLSSTWARSQPSSITSALSVRRTWMTKLSMEDWALNFWTMCSTSKQTKLVLRSARSPMLKGTTSSLSTVSPKWLSLCLKTTPTCITASAHSQMTKRACWTWSLTMWNG